MYPGLQDQSRLLCNLKLHGPLCFLLHHYCSRCHVLPMSNVTYAKLGQVAASWLAVDGQIEES